MTYRLSLLAGLLPALLLCTALAIPTVSAQDEAAKTETPAATEEKADTAKAKETPDDKAAAAPPVVDERSPEEKTETPAPEASMAAVVPINETQYALDNITLFICAALVIFMQAGFALVETGLNAAKNAVNIMFKNYMDFMLGAVLFYLVGYGIMYPPGDNSKDWIPNVIGFAGFGAADLQKTPEGTMTLAESPLPTAEAAHPLGPHVNFLFQVAFAATAATIVSGSVAGRIKFGAYLIYTAAITAVIYPVSGMWMWGYGWLFDMGFKDFAGSTVVHLVGGMAGLAGAIALGPRIGRFFNGKPVPMPGHNIVFAALGVFILMIGWYGFNPGSQLAFTGKSNTDTMMLVAVNTTLACCTGSLAAMAFSWILFKKPDFTFALNGGLAGLVSITANCHCVSYNSALMIGAIGGIVVCLGIMLLDKLQIDDPVGAFPVHGCCGLWAGIATGIFGLPELAAFNPDAPLTMTTQIIGTLSIAGWALGTSLALFFALKAVGFLRVPVEEELAGLDITEHGMYAYPPQLVVDFPGTGGMPASGFSPAMASHAKPSTEAI